MTMRLNAYRHYGEIKQIWQINPVGSFSQSITSVYSAQSTIWLFSCSFLTDFCGLNWRIRLITSVCKHRIDWRVTIKWKKKRKKEELQMKESIFPNVSARIICIKLQLWWAEITSNAAVVISKYESLWFISSIMN